MSVLSAAELKSIASDENKLISTLNSYNEQNAGTAIFSGMDFFDRKEFVALIEHEASRTPQSSKTAVPLLNTIRLICRDQNQVDVLFTDTKVGKYVVDWAFPADFEPLKDASSESAKVLLEGVKCLINGLYSSSAMRSQFGDAEHERLRCLLEKYTLASKSSEDVSSVNFQPYHLLLRLIFITTALQVEKRGLWLSDSYYKALEDVLDESVTKAVEDNKKDYMDRVNEVLKIFFNLYCKSETAPEHERVSFIMRSMRRLLHSTATSDPDCVQNCVNLLAPLPVLPDELCPVVREGEKVAETFESRNMTLMDVFVRCMDRKMDENDTDLLGTYLTVLIQYSIACKEARRYIRLKILPPLSEKDVARRPDEGTTLRNKLVRVMMGVSKCSVLASELMFVLCKRSVGRMIKYTGLGHSAGLLANSGLLGQINCPKSDENSEDSETEEYQEVEPRVNPVTGCIRPPEGPSPFEGMSEEQKEFEAMRLVDAMHQLMDQGMIKPGTIGEDGKPRSVKHVLELTKDIPDAKTDSDSD